MSDGLSTSEALTLARRVVHEEWTRPGATARRADLARLLDHRDAAVRDYVREHVYPHRTEALRAALKNAFWRLTSPPVRPGAHRRTPDDWIAEALAVPELCDVAPVAIRDAIAQVIQHAPCGAWAAYVTEAATAPAPGQRLVPQVQIKSPCGASVCLTVVGNPAIGVGAEVATRLSADGATGVRTTRGDKAEHVARILAPALHSMMCAVEARAEED